MTTVLPTSRAIREQLLELRSQNTLLQRFMTMGELMSRAVVVEGFGNVDPDTRTLTLLEAADFDAFSELKIERNFFTFTRNAAYLFRFFEELSGELVDIDALDSADTYGDFAEHIAILKLLRERYRQLCFERKILDRIFVPELYRLNRAWVEAQGAMEVLAEGYLTNFELQLLREIAGLVPLTLRFDATPYNGKMQQKLAELGVETAVGNQYQIDLASLSIAETVPLRHEASIKAMPLSERILQSAFVKQKVYEMISEGIVPERIAVVLPDEGFVPLLRGFDAEGNFNFAMGEGVQQSLFVRRCEALMAFAEHPGVENTMRLERLFGEGYRAMISLYAEGCDSDRFTEVTEALLEGESEAVGAIVREERFYFERLIPRLGESSLRSLLHLFINRVRGRSLDDVRGGKVTVMGVLETRGCRFDGVIIVDFNDAYVPHRSDKDLFINSLVRGRAGLPTTGEREALQKQFYYQLISRARRVEISYVSNETTLPSRFLKEMGIDTERRYADDAWAEILFSRTPKRSLPVEAVEADYDFSARPLSATALKTFLECRRRFYHRYVAAIAPHELPREMPEEHAIGNALHNALRDVYAEQEQYRDAKTLKAAVAQALAAHSGGSPLERFLEQLWLKKLDPFFEHEINRFAEVRVKACETKLTMEHAGLTLEGRIDRIDHGPEGLEVLDYKSGKYPLYTVKTVENATDFQLEFYALLSEQLGEVAYAGYYDLNSGEIVRDPLHGRKRELLDGHLAELRETKRFSFDLTEELSACRFCDYAHLCQREMQ
ncbi:PD-(D/E)XK nuclease family protein [Sulfurimonas sp. ST-25]|uniref:PD-(D/E)XK nuclease family protein n=1 Tax=Sulfurimonas sp. ST-25 TaxID=3400151 RepID=UPI003A8A0D33